MGIGRIVKGIGEYFLGIESYKYWKKEKSFAKEFYSDKQDLEDRIYEIDVFTNVDVVIKKVFPTLFDIGAIIYSITTKTPPYSIAGGEALRGLFHLLFPGIKKMREMQKETDIGWTRIFQILEEKKKEDKNTYE